MQWREYRLSCASRREVVVSYETSPVWYLTLRLSYFTFEKSVSNSLIFPSGKNTMTFVLAVGSKLSYANRAVNRER